MSQPNILRRAMGYAAQNEDVGSGGVVHIYKRGIVEYEDDLVNAIELVRVKERELASAHEQVQKAQANFVGYCKARKLPVDMQPYTIDMIINQSEHADLYRTQSPPPQPQYKFEDN